MSKPAPKGRTPNPFYIAVVLAGTAFVLTALGWLAAPAIQIRARNVAPGAAVPGAGSVAMAAWLDRWATTALAIEVVVLIAAGLLAMATDGWFRGEPGRDRP